MLSFSSKHQEQVKNDVEKRRWWLFNAKDFHSLMYPCFIFCRILGILPYRINAASSKTSKLDYILSAVVTCFFCLSALIICINISRFQFEEIQRIVEMHFNYILGSIMMIVTCFSSRPRIQLFQTIMKISSILPAESFSQQSVLIHAKDILGMFSILVQSYFWHSRSVSTINYVITLYIILLECLMTILYVNCVCVLKTCFKKINDDLADLLIVHDELHSVMRMYHKQKNPLLLMKLNALRKQHLIVSDTVKSLKLIFSPQLIIILTRTFTETTFDLYYHFVEWHNGLSIVLNKHIYQPYFIFFIACDVAKIMLIAWVCETGKDRALKISTTIHDVLNSTNDEQIKYELNLFALQVMHCDNTFSAKGLSLNATLITAMVGTIATYLLILIQFLIMEHSCDGITTAMNITQATS